MAMTAVGAPPHASTAFHHEALLYAGQQEFLDRSLSFIEQGTAQREAVLVAVSHDKIDLLRQALGPDASAVRFADMATIGRNPATIIPVWTEFVDESARCGRRCRGIGEPVWPDRDRATLVECRNHEALLNTAFDGDFGWRLLCPYDTEVLSAAAVANARATHPYLADRGASRRNAAYESGGGGWPVHAQPLPPPATPPREITFEGGSMHRLRSAVTSFARRCGLESGRLSDLVIAVNELVGNSVQHGGGSGTLRLWRDDDVLLCEVVDHGSISDPLVGRRRPAPEQVGGRGLWIVNHVCDLVQVRSHAGQCVVRVHMSLSP
jgi:anti-sigma regulatory factor (Ser/Thr protein kinase)